MFHLKLTAFALGAATTLGFVWLARGRKTPARGQPVDAERLARKDAFRAFAADADAEVDASYEEDEEDANIGDAPFEEPLPTEEHYDAVDPEEIGSEWLSRAIDSPSSHPEANRFSDDGDALEELPVGLVDTEGNTELHPPKRPSKSAVDLSPNDEELAQRAAEVPDSDERHE
jgi:hypothetical protein